MRESSRPDLAKPPSIAGAIVAGCVGDPEVREALLGDLAEEFAQRSALFGKRLAAAWYWKQAAGAILPLARAALVCAPATVVAWAVVAYLLAGAALLGGNALLSYVVLPRFMSPAGSAYCAVFTSLSLMNVAVASAGISYARQRRCARAPVPETLVTVAIWLLCGAVWIGVGLGSSPVWYRISFHVAGVSAALISTASLVLHRFGVA